MNARALSSGWYVDLLMSGPLQVAIPLGHGHLRVGSYVITLTAPGAPRMPNGLESSLTVHRGDPVLIGDGEIKRNRTSISRGPVWEARPDVEVRLDPFPRVVPSVSRLLGVGEGLTPQGDDVLVGYLAGRVLFRGVQAEADPFGMTGPTTSLSSTLLRHACRGELPEPAHALLSEGDPEPLLRFGHSSGRAMLVGLALACPPRSEDLVPPTLVMTIRDVEGLPDTIVRIFSRPRTDVGDIGSLDKERASA